MKLPEEVYEFADQVAVLDRGDFDQFLSVCTARGKTPDDVAHVLNAYVNQWIRKSASPRNPVGALVALLEPEKRDRLNSGSWTIKKWVAGKRADMLKAAERERKKKFAELISAGAGKFVRRTPEERSDMLSSALTWYRANNPRPDILDSILQAKSDDRIGRFPPKDIIGLTSSGFGCFLAEEGSEDRWIRLGEKSSESGDYC